MRLNPHLTFDGRCREAFAFYADALNGRITEMLTYGESPLASEFGAGTAGRILHASLAIDGETVTGADEPPGRYREPSGISIMLNIGDVGEAERIFSALSAGGKMTMELRENFWAKRFGMTTDRFGIPWMLNCS